MAVAEIQKINIIAHKDFKKQILELLYDAGFIEIISLAKDSDEQPTIIVTNQTSTEYELAKIKYALEFFTCYLHEKKSFLEKLNSERARVSYDDIKILKSEYNYISITETAENISQKLNSLKSLVSKLEEEKKLLFPWKNAPVVTQSDLETTYTKSILGSIDKKKYYEVMESISKEYKELEIIKYSEDETTVYFRIVLAKKYEKDLLAVMTTKEFKSAELPLLKITPRERIKKIEEELRNINDEISKIEKKAGSLAQGNFKKLEVIFDFLTWQLHQEQIQENFSFTKSSFSILGWIKKVELPELRDKLKEITNTVEVFFVKTEENEPVPIAMVNSKLIRPFEFVTNIYGFPRYKEVDPTPFLAGFFILFFGLCLTDAGYGLALTICAFLALKYLKFSSGFKKLLKVLFYGGIITFFAGGLTGGWFGIVLEDLPASLNWLAKPLIAIRQINPVKEPITMLVISIFLGYIHLLFGNIINLWWKIKHGEVKSGLVDSGVWLYFLLTIGFLIVTRQEIILPYLAKPSLFLVYSAIALIILTQGKSRNPVIKIFGGLAGLYFGITGYISDILSYSRLLALGLATGIIGFVINIIGAMANDMIPYVGWFFMILIIIGGHLMNLVISLVGAFIHSGRLQYVEFFKRFFDGGGKEFNPFIRESKYINLVKK